MADGQKKSITIQNFFKDKASILLLILNIIFLVFSWVYLYMKVKPQEDPIFLHYNIYFGVDLIGNWYLIFLMPAIGLACFFINLVFSYIIYKRSKIISYVILGITGYIELIIAIASLLIIRQNI